MDYTNASKEELVSKLEHLQCSYDNLLNSFRSKVDELEKYSREIKIKEEHYRLLTENIKDVVWILDAETLMFRYVSPSIERLLGFTPEEMQKRPFTVFFTPEISINIGHLHLQHIQSIKNGEKIPEFITLEVEQPCKNGSTVWTEVIISYYINPDNQRIEVRGVARDISERRKVIQEVQLLNEELQQKNSEFAALNEEYLVQNEELHYTITVAEENERNLIEAQRISKIANWHLDIVNLQMDWSQQCYHILEIKNKLQPGRLKFEFFKRVYPEDLKNIFHLYKEALRNKTGFSTECRIRVAEKFKYLNLIAEPVFEIDQLVAFRGTLQDISDRKIIETELILAKEKAEESDCLKTAFLQNMSHEIRTPMNAIIGFTELLTYNYDNKQKLEHYAEIINNRCLDLLNIINDLLDIAKIESGQLNFNAEQFNLGNFLAELYEFFNEYKKRLKKQYIHFVVEIDDILKNTVIVSDRMKLKQILINLITNAFKFTDKGEILCSCKMYHTNQLIFQVKDTGIGIPKEKQHLIFERFIQIEKSEARIYGGTGLGLSIVKGLVKIIGGDVWFSSEVGKGTSFFFTLNVKYAANAKEKDFQIEYRGYDASSLKDKLILIVEDDIFNLKLIEEIIKSAGSKYIIAKNGRDAVTLAIQKKPDIILMDIGLPDITGYEATKTILQHNIDARIIAQTAYATEDDKQKAYEAGCIGFISKPLKSKDLLTLISCHLPV